MLRDRLFPAAVDLPQWMVQVLPPDDLGIDALFEVFFSNGGTFSRTGKKIGLRATFEIDRGSDLTLPGLGRFAAAQRVEIDVVLADARSLEAEGGPGSSGQSIHLDLRLETALQLQLPTELQEGLLTLETGDAAGWIPVMAKLSIAADESQGWKPTATLVAGDSHQATRVAHLQIGLPGSVGTDAPVEMMVRSLEMTIGAAAGPGQTFSFEWAARLVGDFRFRFPTFGRETLVEPLLRHWPVWVGEQTMSLREFSCRLDTTLSVEIDNDQSIRVQLVFRDPVIRFDPFLVIAQLAAGRPEPRMSGRSGTVPLEQGLTFRLDKLALQLPQAGQQGFLIEFGVAMGFGALTSAAFLRLKLSNGRWELQLGLEGADFPVNPPMLPLKSSELSAADGLYHLAKSEASAELERRLALLSKKLEEQGDGAGKRQLPAKQALLLQIFAMRGRLRDWDDPVFLHWLEAIVEAVEKLLPRQNGCARGCSLVLGQGKDAPVVFEGLHLVIEEFVLSIPFDNPRDMAVKGRARLRGFVGAYSVLNDIVLSAGVSSTMIYFQLDTAGVTVPLPAIGANHAGGSVTIGELRFGFGYTTRAVAFALVGELVLPEALVDDLDTSESGLGVRLPEQSAINIRFDLMPFVLPKVVVLVPYFEFGINLRKPGRAGIAATERCLPAWDGLQLILKDDLLKDVLRVGFKEFTPSAFTGPIPAENLRIGFDVDLGQKGTGMSLVCDDLLVMFPILNEVAVPLLFCLETPFVENCCINLRVEGFELNLDLQRPVPRFSPLALFEALALLSDPTVEVDPGGELGNVLSASVRDLRISVPESASRLFPGLARQLPVAGTWTLNLATYIEIVQVLWKLLGPPLRALLTALEDVTATVPNAAALVRNIAMAAASINGQAPRSPERQRLDQAVWHLFEALGPATAKLGAGELRVRLQKALRTWSGDSASALALSSVHAVLRALPAACRRFRVAASFGPFEGEAVLLLVSEADADAELRRRAMPATAVSRTVLNAGEAFDISALSQSLGKPPAAAAAGANWLNPDENLFAGELLDSVEPGLLEDVRSWRKAQSMSESRVMVAVRIEWLPGAYLGFVGYLFENGRFGLLSFVKGDSLKLRIGRFNAPLPFKVKGRLALEGYARRTGVEAAVRAEGSVTKWEPLPGLLRLDAKELTLRVASIGRFVLAGKGEVRMLDGLLRIDGELAVDELQLTASGRIEAAIADGIDLSLQVTGQAGPAQQFHFAGSGDLEFIGHRLPLTCELSERGLRLASRWQGLGIGALDCSATVEGRLWRGDGGLPELELAGFGSLRLFGFELADARCGLRSDGTRAFVWFEGSASWNGEPWSRLRVEVDDDGIRLQGQGLLVFPTVPQLPIQAHLNMAVLIELQFDLDARNVLLASLQGQWALAIEHVVPGPGGRPARMLPVATGALPRHDLPFKVVDTGPLYLPAFGSLDLSGLTISADAETLKIPKIPDSVDLPSARGWPKFNEEMEISFPNPLRLWEAQERPGNRYEVPVGFHLDASALAYALADATPWIQRLDGVTVWISWSHDEKRVVVAANEPAPLIPVRYIDIKLIAARPFGKDSLDEHVIIINRGREWVELEGWQIEDASAKRHRYVLPAYRLAPGESLTIWSGAGENRAGHVYWNRKAAVWNNDGDTAVIKDRQGVEVTRKVFKRLLRPGGQ